MADRPHGTPSSRQSTRARPGGRGMGPGGSAYKPVRSPLVSMGPSLVEEQRRHTSWRRGIVITVLTLVAIALLAWLVMLLGHEVVSGDPVAPRTADPLTIPVGKPTPQALAQVATEGSEATTRLQLPIQRRAITAIGYDHVADAKVLPLEPEGGRSNLSFGERLFRRFLATEQESDLRYLMLAQGGGDPNVVNVGAAAGTDAYAPISGTVIAIADNVLDDMKQGVVVQIQPLGDAETVVVLRNLDAAPDLAVGQTVSEGTTLVGYVRRMESATATAALARYTHDDGSNLELYVRRVQLEPAV